MRVLVVEDEKRLALSISEILNENNIETDISNDGEEALGYALLGEYNVIVLDVMLPGMDGFEIVEELRKENVTTPVLFLTAKDSIQDKVHGLNQGGDDYMVKPFNAQELVARVNALARRKNEILTSELQVGDLVLDTNLRLLKSNQNQIQLGTKEFLMIELFMESPNQVFSKEQIINKVWGLDSDADENNVETYISFIRKKLSYLKTNVSIKTIRKLGYHLQVNDHDS